MSRSRNERRARQSQLKQLTSEQRAQVACAAQIASALRATAPLRPEADLIKAAQKACAFQADAAQLLEEYVNDTISNGWSVAVVRQSAIVGGTPNGVVAASARRLDLCVGPDEALRHVTFLALLQNPVARALLHLDGYDLVFGKLMPNTDASTNKDA